MSTDPLENWTDVTETFGVCGPPKGDEQRTPEDAPQRTPQDALQQTPQDALQQTPRDSADSTARREVGRTPVTARSTPGDTGQRLPVDAQGIFSNKYRLIELLGRGGMGEVWLVEHIHLEVQRALKLIKADVAEKSSIRRRFDQEAKILAKLKHPNAVAVHDAGIVGEHAYIEMDYLQGQTLRHYLTPGQPLPLRRILFFLDELCKVLGQAHKLGIVHRDIKPENIMVLTDPETGEEQVKVLDFGIAKLIHELGAESVASTMHTEGPLGTAAYCSPEQLGYDLDTEKRTEIDHRSDLYSTGVMLYEMLVGARPFSGKYTQLLIQHAKTPPPRFAEKKPGIQVHRDIEKVVMRCLEKDPRKRPQSAGQLLEAFREAVREAEPDIESTEIPVRHGWRSEGVRPNGRTTGGTGFLTEIGFPRELPRKAILRLFVLFAIVSGIITGGIILGLLRRSPVFDTHDGKGPVEPDPTRTPAPLPPTFPELVTNYLKSRGFKPDGTDVHQGWPSKIRRISSSADSRPLVLHENLYYLPEGYKPLSAETEAGTDLPRAVQSRDGTIFRLIRGGEFEMGAWESNTIQFDPLEKPRHRRTLSSYYMQETEVTNQQFEIFISNTFRNRASPELADFYLATDRLKKRMAEDWKGCPAVGISHRLAEEYAHKVGGELPSEGQWEFAARSRGNKRLYVWSKDENDQEGLSARDRRAHVDDPLGGDLNPLPVETIKRTYGDRTDQFVYDLAGNVREWCRDVWQRYQEGVPWLDYVEPIPAGEKHPRYVIRGGSFDTPPYTARVSWRASINGVSYQIADDDPLPLDVGFRVVLEVVECRPKDAVVVSNAESSR